MTDDPRRPGAEEHPRGRSGRARTHHEHVAVAPFDIVDRLLPARPRPKTDGTEPAIVSNSSSHLLTRSVPNGAWAGTANEAMRSGAPNRAARAAAASTSPAEPPNAAVTRSTRAPGRARNACGANATGMGEPCRRRAVTLPIAGCPDVPTTIIAAPLRSATSSRPAGADRAWSTTEDADTSPGSLSRARSSASRAMPSRSLRYSLSSCAGSPGNGDGTTAHRTRSSCAERASIPARCRTAPPRPSGAYPTTSVTPTTLSRDVASLLRRRDHSTWREADSCR